MRFSPLINTLGQRPWFLVAHLVLLLAFPIAWFAPLIRAGLLPIFGLSEISIITGITALLDTDVILAAVVIFFALIAPIVKLLGNVLIGLGRMPERARSWVQTLGKFAMADIFLIALYIVIIKGGIGVGRVETAWGLYLFTLCVLGSYLLSLGTKARVQP